MLQINQSNIWTDEKWIVRFVRLKIKLENRILTKVMFERMKVNNGILKIKFERRIFE